MRLTSPIDIRLVTTDEEREWCAQQMATSEPWVTLGRDLDASRRLVADPSREAYVARVDHQLVGFVIVTMAGPFPGYLQTVYVAPHLRGGGMGAHLIAFAENRIFRESPNVFLCVSSFNPRARRLYEGLGYVLVGHLHDYVIAGQDELLFRKTIGPWSAFTAPAS